MIASRREVRIGLACLLAAAMLGCGGSDTAVDSTSAASGSRAAMPPRPGDLTKSIDTYSEQELEQFAQGIGFQAPHAAQARDCGAGNTCEARISALAGMSFGPGNIGPHGTLVALMQLTTPPSGNVEEDVYKLRPGAGNKYYLIVLPDPNAGPAPNPIPPEGWVFARWTLREVNGGGNPTTVPPREVSSGVFRRCPDNHTPPSNQAMFSQCPDSSVAGPLRNDPDAPGWLNCDQGCCTAGIS